ncbi:unnamed protein product [Kuraishia capsulata CBS 1993]|uniref:Uncharacterized protein n=1 Tax=Kuraishia capsulata CBS 1993 TaxID=1382522 RepID=W6MR02_9ASCO|nr:uncharacterized protein KUCA_T00005151001 [Kuraishia capsulata CBS 1993]CDK29164.1 unnamed protein product [Kuraishia capsulata CBS 1993]
MPEVLSAFSESPEQVFSGKANYKDALEEVKALLDPITSSNSILDEIHVKGLVASQVWGQVKMVVDGVSENLLFEQIPSIKERLGEEEQSEEDEALNEVEEQLEQENNSEESDSDESDSEEYFTPTEDPELPTNSEFHDDYSESEGEVNDEAEELVRPQPDKFGLNDDFFSIDEFNKQSMAMEDPEFGQDDDNDEDDVDIFGDLDDDDDEEVVMYEDFFAAEKARNQQNSKRKHEDDDEDEEEEDFGGYNEGLAEEDYDAAFETLVSDFKAQPAENLSTFEKQQLEIQKEIAQLEKEQIADKKWQFKGEVTSKQRDHDTLLDDSIQFDRNAKPVPVITSETSETLEEIIRRRILNSEFDELEKRVLNELKFKPSERVEVSEKKAEKSLAELYEDQYKGVDGSKAEDELKAAHDEISGLFNNLMFKLDALSSAHFRPKNKQATLDIKVETPTISMEDAQPLTMGNSSSLAPQEVYSTKTRVGKDEVQLRSGVVMSKEELSRSDKQRLRRAKKRKVSKK